MIVAVDGKMVLGYQELLELVQPHRAGDKLALKISRNKQNKDIVLVLGQRPAGQPPGQGRPAASSTRPFAAALGGQRENVQERQGPDGFQTGGVYKSTDGGETWTRINSVNPRPMYFSQVRVDPILQRGQTRFLQSGDLGLGERLVDEVRERRTPPYLECLSQESGRGQRVTLFERAPALRHERLDTLRRAVIVMARQ